MIKVCLVDDHKILRIGLKQLLSEDKEIQVVDECNSIEETIKKIFTSKWNVIVLDINLPGLSGLEGIKEIKAIKPDIPILILSMYDIDHYGIRLIKADAAGYLTKDTGPEELITAIKQVATGKKYINAKFAELLATTLSQKDTLHSYELLSDREFEVLKMIGCGHSLTDISKTLKLSIKTISTYRSRIIDKLAFESNSDIIRYCVKHDLIQ